MYPLVRPMRAVVERPTAKMRADNAGCFLRMGAGALFCATGAGVDAAADATATVGAGTDTAGVVGGGYMVSIVFARSGSIMISRHPHRGRHHLLHPGHRGHHRVLRSRHYLGMRVLQ